MKRAKWIVFAVTLAVAPSLFAAESYRRCLDNCAGNKSCTECCDRQGRPAMEPCVDNCIRVCKETDCKQLYPNSESDYKDCLHRRRFPTGSKGKFFCEHRAPIREAFDKCLAKCYTTTQIAGGCRR